MRINWEKNKKNRKTSILSCYATINKTVGLLSFVVKHFKHFHVQLWRWPNGRNNNNVTEESRKIKWKKTHIFIEVTWRKKKDPLFKFLCCRLRWNMYISFEILFLFFYFASLTQLHFVIVYLSFFRTRSIWFFWKLNKVIINEWHVIYAQTHFITFQFFYFHFFYICSFAVLIDKISMAFS